MKKLIGIQLFLFLFVILIAMPSYAKRVIQGTVTMANGSPANGYRVRAYDDDPAPNPDEKMGEAFTNAAGRYWFQYKGRSWDGPHSRHHTQWRPDIYIVVAKSIPGGGWKRVATSGIRKNHKLKNNITQNFQVPIEGECPSSARFSTTNTWRGCKCPAGMHKRYLDLFKRKARCASGCSGKVKCHRKCADVSQNESRGSVWFGYDKDHGKCVKPSNIYAVYRQAYYKYFQTVRKGVVMESLPPWVIKRYDNYYPHVHLTDIRIGESTKTPDNGTAITDCKKIYFPAAANELARIRTESNPDYFWLLHEMAHSNQCMGLNKGRFSTKRDKYADMWFSQLPKTIVGSILADGIPVGGSVHDHMPMEKDADRKAAQIIKVTGIGTTPNIPCPGGEFSTRKHRGCKCPNGTTKHYRGLFKGKVRCTGMRVVRPHGAAMRRLP